MKYKLSSIKRAFFLIRIFLLILVTMLPATVKADEISVLKEALATSDPKIEAMGSKLPAIKYLIRNGFLNSHYEQYDYSRIYFPKKKIIIFGASLVALDHEYSATGGHGCCVSPGISILLVKENQFDLKALTAFAKKYKCTAWSGEEPFLADYIKGLRDTFNPSDIVQLSCKERDRWEHTWTEKAKKFILNDQE